ncbi:MAG: radical SAM/SPASM domain-containing protein [Campylobacteraceae bacterium]|jgi:radical SAM protein with 4Fe4S-binding SPASM domain|nr:radical SAM/SPASM domain-containing protein [Campylobacteraceae bacterium]MBT3881859.1 radical SAM/SPASM domain-containing protein [Campylobacteraceae bacterium]MBT4030829.1 radical SAM/SPASM domain-containing protein [Campylobacteraceae bacterium]MBT4179398.1 radical SAM/SPASM domain-containing protein [Campylobacteraceae bacterium]MBT4572633.1 radical SAM/SPASM domain-containing protein [Campylobacteraceae bacterium]
MKFNKIYVELTNICGLACSFCPSQKPPTSTMSLKTFEDVLIQIKPYTKIITYHMFGDPLTLSNLKEYLDLTLKYNIQVELVTTGYYLNKFDLNLFLHPAIRQINFSLNSFNKNDMNMTLDQYLEPMFKICDLKLKNKIHNFVNFRLWNLNPKKKSYKFNTEVIQKIENKFNLYLDIENQESIRLENQIKLHFDNYFQWPSLESTNNTNGTCYGLKSHFGILSSGDVVPCCLDSNGYIKLGNIHESSLDKILNSKRSVDIINGFKDNKAIEELCKKCTFKHRFNEDISIY